MLGLHRLSYSRRRAQRARNSKEKRERHTRLALAVLITCTLLGMAASLLPAQPWLTAVKARWLQ